MSIRLFIHIIVQSVSIKIKFIIPENNVKMKKKENNDIVEFQKVSNNSSDIKYPIYVKVNKHRI